MFEIRTDNVILIRSSIRHNSFSTDNVHVFHNAVRNLPTNSMMSYPPDGAAATGEDPIFYRNYSTR